MTATFDPLRWTPETVNLTDTGTQVIHTYRMAVDAQPYAGAPMMRYRTAISSDLRLVGWTWSQTRDDARRAHDLFVEYPVK